MFTATAETPLQGWQSLMPYSVGIIRGIKFAEANTRAMNRRVVSSYDVLFRMLLRGRLEVGVVPRINGLQYQHTSGAANIRKLRPPVDRFDLFHYLHKKHRALVPQVVGVIAAMKAEGVPGRIRTAVNAKILDLARSSTPVCADYACLEQGGVDEVVFTFLRGDVVDEISDAAPCFLDGARLELFEQAFQFGEGLFDGVEVG